MNTSADRQGGAPLPPRHTPGTIERILAAIIRYWALAGGIITAALAVLTAASAASNILFQKPFASDYELVKHFIGVAVFMFLPYCQLTGSNVTVDIFTENIGERKKAAMAAFSSIFAIAFSLLLLRQMSLGFLRYLRYPEVTPVLQLPLWTAFPPILVSLALLLAAAIITAIDGWRGVRGLPMATHAPHDSLGE